MLLYPLRQKASYRLRSPQIPHRQDRRQLHPRALRRLRCFSETFNGQNLGSRSSWLPWCDRVRLITELIDQSKCGRYKRLKQFSLIGIVIIQCACGDTCLPTDIPQRYLFIGLGKKLLLCTFQYARIYAFVRMCHTLVLFINNIVINKTFFVHSNKVLCQGSDCIYRLIFSLSAVSRFSLLR